MLKQIIKFKFYYNFIDILLKCNSVINQVTWPQILVAVVIEITYMHIEKFQNDLSYCYDLVDAAFLFFS